MFASKDTPWGNGVAPWEGPNGMTERLEKIYEANNPYPLILQPNVPGPNVSTFNFPATIDVDEDQIRHAVEINYDRQEHAFKLYLSLGSF